MDKYIENPSWRIFLNKVKKFIYSKWSSLVLVFCSIFYGLEVTRNPQILRNFEGYRILLDTISSNWVGVLFIVLSVIKLIGILTNQRHLMMYSVIALTSLWSLLWLSLASSVTPNTVWVLCAGMVLTGIGINMRED